MPCLNLVNLYFSPYTFCVALRNLLNLFEPQFFNLYNETHTYLIDFEKDARGLYIKIPCIIPDPG